ncbi:MAG TPA: hypothetical protein VF188_02475 [Longimicrobiales bacterium]
MARIALINQSCVEPEAIADICEAATLPDDEILLIVGDSKLSSDYQGVTLPRQLAGYATDLFGLQDYLHRNWDCGVSISPTWADRQPDFPAYFAFLLGHEFGHATTALTDLGVAFFEDLVLRYIPRVAPRKWRWDDMPHEQAYDQFGMTIAGKIYGRDTVEWEFVQIVEQGLPADAERLRKILSLEPRADVSHVRSALANFRLPYKDDLLRVWKADVASGCLKLIHGLRDFALLWDAS